MREVAGGLNRAAPAYIGSRTADKKFKAIANG